MAFDAGSIRTEAELDLAAFQRSMTTLQGAVTQVNATLGSIKTPSVAVDTAPAQQQITAAQGSLKGLITDLLNIPKGTVAIDTANAQAGLGALQGALGGVAQQMGTVASLGGLASVLGAGSAVAAITAATTALVALGQEFVALNREIANLTGATGEALAQLQQDFRALAGSVPASGQALVQILAIVNTKLHETGAEARATATDLVAFSRIMGGDPVSNARELVAVLTAFNVSQQDSHKFLGDLTRAMELTGTSIGEMGSLLTRDAIILQEFNLTGVESVELLEGLTKAGVPPRLMLAALREAFNNAAKGGADMTTFLKDAFLVIKETPDETQAAIAAAKVFGESLGPQMAVLIRQGRVALGELQEKVDETGNVLEGSFARGRTAQARFQTTVEGVKVEVAALGVEFFKAAAGGVAALADAILVLDQEARNFADSGAVHVIKDIVTFLIAHGDELKAATAGTPLGGVSFGVGLAQGNLEQLQRAAQAIRDQRDASEVAEKSLANLNTAQGKGTTVAKSFADAQANVAKGMKEATASLEEQLKALSDIGQIQGLLEARNQVKDLDQAISTLTNTSIAALLVAEKNMALAIGESTGDWSRWDAAVQGARQALADQKTEEENVKAAQEAQKKALAEQKKLMEEVAAVAGDQYGKRLEELANTLLPGVSNETAVLIKQLLLQKEPILAAQVATAAYGLTLDDFRDGLQGTVQDFDNAKKHAEELAKAMDPNKLLRDELQTRSRGLFDALIGSFDAATQAALRHQASIEGDAGAVRDALVGMGADAATFDAAWQAALNGSADAAKQFQTEAVNALKFLQTGAIPQVPAPPKDAVAAFAEAMGKAQETLADATTKMNEELRKAKETYEDETASILATIQNAEDDFDAAMDKLDRQDQEARANFADAAQKRAEEFARTLHDLFRESDKAVADAETSIANAQDDLRKTLKDTSESATKSIQDLNEKAAASTQQAVEAQQQALTSFSQSLTAIRDQEAQANLAFSRSMQDLTEQSLSTQQTHETANELAKARLRLQQDFGLQEAQLSTQEASARSAFGKAMTAAERQAQQQAQAMAKELAKILEEQRKKEKEAREKEQKAIQDADAKLQDKLDELARKRDDEERKRAEAEEKARKDEAKRQRELSDRRAELERKRAEDEAKAEREREKADRKYAERVADIQQAEDKAIQAFQKTQLEAQKDLQRAVSALEKILGQHNELLRAALRRQGIAMPMDFRNTTIQETGVDFIEKAVVRAEARLRQL